LAQLELVGVSKSFGKNTAVKDIDLMIRDNELFCLFGPSGCGKTTILKLLVGLEIPDKGKIMIDQRDVTFAPPAERNLAMVFQNLALFPHLPVRENLAFPLVERRLPQSAIEARMAQVAATLQITPLLDKLPAHLSGGERQRVAIGRALMRDPQAYLLDEPISALDARLREAMRVELGRLQRDLKHTFVHVTHDQEEAMALADRMAIMNEGRIVQVGTPVDLYGLPFDRYVAEQLGSLPINLFAGTLHASGLFVADELALTIPTGLRGFDRRVLLGARPEDIGVSAGPSDDAEVTGKVIVFQQLGATTVLDVMVGTKTIKVETGDAPPVGLHEDASLSITLEKCHVFDAVTQRRLHTGLGRQQPHASHLVASAS
jgi:multiple sugar transport system ATP-binding protein